MLAVLLAMLAAGSAASPSPSPSPSPGALQTIVTVKSSPFCSAFTDHVNAAIGAAVSNNDSLGDAVTALRSDALGNGILQRTRQEQRLSKLANDLYKNYRSGEAEVIKLRELAKTASSEDEKAAVKASADALGGALYRQHLIQRDLDGFVAFLYAADMRSDDVENTQQAGQMVGSDVETMRGVRVGPATMWMPTGYHSSQIGSNFFPGDESPDDDVQLGILASKDFQQRITSVIQDEITAARHIGTAGNGC